MGPDAFSGKPSQVPRSLKESLNKSFDKLRTNGKCLIPLVVSLSNHERNQLVQGFLRNVSAPFSLLA
jgi:hypothetical protein